MKHHNLLFFHFQLNIYIHCGYLQFCDFRVNFFTVTFYFDNSNFFHVFASNTSDQLPSKLLRTKLGGLSDGVLFMLPERPNLIKAMRRAHHRNLPPNPKLFDDLGVIQKSLKKNKTKRSLVISFFCTTLSTMKTLMTEDYLYLQHDGTWKYLQ